MSSSNPWPPQPQPQPQQMDLPPSPHPPQLDVEPSPQPPETLLPPPSTPSTHMPPPSAPPGHQPGAAESPEGDVPMSYPAPNTPSNVTATTAGPGQWSTGLCACSSDLKNCCITFACPCITFGEIAEIVDRGSSSCPVNGLIYGLLVAVLGGACMYSFFYRTRMRRQYNLKGSSCGDCCVHTWCELCALCQEYRELQLRGFNMSVGWQENLERQNYRVTTTPPMQANMTR